MDKELLVREERRKTHRIQRIRDVNAERLGDFRVTIHTNVLVNGLGLLGTQSYSGWFRTADQRLPRDMTRRNTAIDGPASPQRPVRHRKEGVVFRQ